MMATRPVFQTLSDAEAQSLLARQHVGRLAFTLHDRVDIEPIHFVSDGDWIFGRTSGGTKLSTLMHHPWCALEADEVGGLFDWASVVVKGTFYLLDPEMGTSDLFTRAQASLRSLVPDALLKDDPTPQRSIVFGIFVHEVTGRQASAGT